jgi:hypothetical protein
LYTKNARKSLADIVLFSSFMSSIYVGLLAAGFGVVAGLTTVFGVSAGFAGLDAVLAGGVIFAAGVGLVEDGVSLFTSGFAPATSVEIAPLVHICARFSLLISNSIAARFGLSGTAGSVIGLPLVISCTF